LYGGHSSCTVITNCYANRYGIHRLGEDCARACHIHPEASCLQGGNHHREQDAIDLACEPEAAPRVASERARRYGLGIRSDLELHGLREGQEPVATGARDEGRREDEGVESRLPRNTRDSQPYRRQGTHGEACARGHFQTVHSDDTLYCRDQKLGLLAEAYGKAGQRDEGLTALTEALAIVEKNGECYYEAELYRLKGALLLDQTAPDACQAEECFQQALAIARRQQAQSWELRAALSLSHLWQCQGKRAEARQLLAEVYSWFTEGFDTADLQGAKALLEVL